MKHLSRRHRAVSAIYTAAILVVLTGFSSFAVDYGRVQLAKAQLEIAADAAARAAAHDLPTSVAAAQSSAVAIAAANTCYGVAVALDVNNDIEFGAWNTNTLTFTVLTGSARSSANAIRITARRTASRGTALPLVFAPLVGQTTCDVHASAIARVTVSQVSGFQGLGSVTLKNNAFFGSYNSSINRYPTQASAYSNCLLGSNGAITVKNNDSVKGSVQVGPSGSVDLGLFVTGTTTTLTTPLPTPTLPAWSPGVNPGGVPQNYTVNSPTVLPAGTYWFTALTLNANLTFAGPATVYVNGNVAVGGTLAGFGDIPSNLQVYQYGSGRTFGDSGSNGMTIIADVVAPGADFSAKNNMTFYGQATFNSIELKNNGDFYYDEAVGSATGAATTKLVQ